MDKQQKRKQRMEQLLAWVKEAHGAEVKKLVAHFSIKTGLDGRRVREYIQIYKDAGIIKEKEGLLYAKTGSV